jgi:hypothetical protein
MVRSIFMTLNIQHKGGNGQMGPLPENRRRYSIQSLFSYQSPAIIVDDRTMRVRNDLNCGKCDSGYDPQLNFKQVGFGLRKRGLFGNIINPGSRGR